MATTPKRLRVYPWLLAGTLWTVVLVNYATPGAVDRTGKLKGTDFVQFWAAAQTWREGRADLLYDIEEQQRRIQAVAPGAKDTLYVPIQSPQTVIAFRPLAALPYAPAFAVWTAITLLLYGLACWTLWQDCRALHPWRRELAGFAVAAPALFSTVIHGQTSVAGLLLVVAGLFALRRGFRLSAGFLLGCLAFKPHWAAVVGLLVLAAREWRVALGMAASGLSQVVITALVFGPSVIGTYILRLRQVGEIGHLLEPRASLTLRGLFESALPSADAALVAYTVSAAVAVWVVWWMWRGERPFDTRVAAFVIVVVLISPHAFEYDLVLLLPALLLIAKRMAEQHAPPVSRGLILAALLVYVAPLAGGLPDAVRLALSVLPMAGILVTLMVTREA